MILMTPGAVDRFETSSSGGSLKGNAGLTVLKWSGKAQTNTGRGDVLLWSNARGLPLGTGWPPAPPASLARESLDLLPTRTTLHQADCLLAIPTVAHGALL